jgi:hypothetical protein
LDEHSAAARFLDDSQPPHGRLSLADNGIVIIMEGKACRVVVCRIVY